MGVQKKIIYKQYLYIFFEGKIHACSSRDMKLLKGYELLKVFFLVFMNVLQHRLTKYRVIKKDCLSWQYN
jgi:hypothetical protein